MRIPRRHKFRFTESGDALLRRLPSGRRFRFASGTRSRSVFGAEPVAVIAASDLEAPEEAALLAQRLRDALPRVPTVHADHRFPGGAVGFVTYERASRIEETDPRPDDGAGLWFGVYDTFATWNPDDEEVEVVSWGLGPDGSFDERKALARARELESVLREPGPEDTAHPEILASRITSSLDRSGHADRVREILEAIRRGDIYQGNLTARFDAQIDAGPIDLFEKLLRDNPAPFGAFVEADADCAISCSPERLLAARGRDVESQPIKGTARRSADAAEDERLARSLASSVKDRAELLMITDLVRNDLGKVCEFGTVRVPELVQCRTYAHVHHLVSTVRGRLARGQDVFDAFEALLPGGSVTGAPKRRAMEILRALEPAPRGVYTGAIGWIGFDRSADLNLSIRSGMMRGETFSFGAGGGIVADSDPDSEWEELLLKASPFLRALGAPVESFHFEGAVR